MKFMNNSRMAVLLLLFVLSAGSSAGEATGVPGMLDGWIDAFNGVLGSVLFFDVFPREAEFPFIVAWLVGNIVSEKQTES